MLKRHSGIYTGVIFLKDDTCIKHWASIAAGPMLLNLIYANYCGSNTWSIL
jgi:hypothetical protein